jgi:hypothetical protein
MTSKLRIAVGAALFAAAQACTAALIELNLSTPLTSAEYSVLSIEDQQLQFSLATSAFVVNDGDTVRVKLLFQDGAVFRLLADPLSPTVGTQGVLVLPDISGLPPYLVEFGFSFAFLDENAYPVLSDSAARVVRSGGDLRGDVTILQGADLSIGGFSMAFGEITNSGIGGLPVTVSGARFLVHNAIVGEPFASTDVSEPGTLALLGVALMGVALRHRRRQSAHAP